MTSGDSGRKGLEVFISYSHEDEEHRRNLEKHLSILSRTGILEIWHDRKIVAGSEWKGQIDQHLASSDLNLLLVSPAFLHSDYCYDVEMRRALERHDQGQAVVIPIVVRPIALELTPFARLQALPREAKAVTTWNNQDEAWVDVARGIKTAADAFLARKRSGIFAPPPAAPIIPPAPAARVPAAKRAAVEEVFTWLISYWGPQFEKQFALEKAESLVTAGLSVPTFESLKETYMWLVNYSGPSLHKPEALGHAERIVAAGVDQERLHLLKDCFSWLTQHPRTPKAEALGLAETLMRKGLDKASFEAMRSKYTWLTSWSGPQLSPRDALRRALQDIIPAEEIREAWLAE